MVNTKKLSFKHDSNRFVFGSSFLDLFQSLPIDRSNVSQVVSLILDSKPTSVLCHVGDFGCGEGGWTPVMKIDGNKVLNVLLFFSDLLVDHDFLKMTMLIKKKKIAMVPQEVACVTGVIGEGQGKEGRREKMWGKFFSPLPPPLLRVRRPRRLYRKRVASFTHLLRVLVLFFFNCLLVTNSHILLF